MLPALPQAHRDLKEITGRFLDLSFLNAKRRVIGQAGMELEGPTVAPTILSVPVSQTSLVCGSTLCPEPGLSLPQL